MRPHRKILHAVMGIAAIASLGSLSGCVAYGNVKSFGGQRDAELKDGTVISMWLRPTLEHVDVPLVMSYNSASPPYSLQVSYRPEHAYHSLEIESVTVQYSSGTKETRIGKRRQTITNFDKEHGITRWNTSLKDLVTRHEDCTISVTGSLITTRGKMVLFSVATEFKAQGSSGMAPYWKAGD